MGDTQSTMQEELEPGDLVEVFRGLYRHWGVYVGGQDREVVHLTVPDGALGVSASGVPSVPIHNRNGLVKKEPLSAVVRGEKYCVNRTYDQKYKRRPVEEIVRDAEATVGEEVGYHLLRNNCEHFATGLRHGVRKSDQVDAGLTIGGAAIAGVVVLAGVAAAAFGILKALAGREEEEFE